MHPLGEWNASDYLETKIIKKKVHENYYLTYHDDIQVKVCDKGFSVDACFLFEDKLIRCLSSVQEHAHFSY